MARASKSGRRTFTSEFKQEAVALMLDGHSPSSVAARLGITNINLLYNWKKKQLQQSDPAMTALDSRVHALEAELQRVVRERDILKKALAIFSRHE